MTELREALQSALVALLPAESVAWLDQATTDAGRRAEALPALFAEAGRKVGRGGMPASTPSLAVGPYQVPIKDWRRADVARALLVLADARRDPASALRRAAERYTNADSEEKVSAVRVVGLIPGALPDAPLAAPPVESQGAEDGRIVALRAILDACRTNILPLFDAATGHNPYFSAAAPELEFNKGVLKRVFVGVPILAVLRLGERSNDELSRMLLNLVEEREISLRPYPPEVLPVLARRPLPGVAAKCIGLIEHPDDQIRAAAAEALSILKLPAAAPFVRDRLAREKQKDVKQWLESGG